VRHGETLANKAGIIQGQSESPLSELGASQAGLVAKALAGVDWWRIVSSDLGRCQQTAKILLEAADGAGKTKKKSSPASADAPPAASAPEPADEDDASVLQVGRHSVLLDPRIREMYAGVYEGLPRGTAHRKAVKIKAKEAGISVKEFGAQEREMESGADLKARAAAFFGWVESELLTHLSEARELAQLAPAGGFGAEAEGPLRMLVVSHGGFIKSLLDLVTEDGPPGMVRNCSITRLEVTPQAGGGGSGGRRCAVRVIEANGTAHLGDQMSESAW